MVTTTSTRLGITIMCLGLLAIACDGGSTAPSAPSHDHQDDPQSVTLAGVWSGRIEGALFVGDARAELTQNGAIVSGDWSVPMPGPLVALDAPADIELGGLVTGTAAQATAELTFGFRDALAVYFGSAQCALDVNVSTFNETRIEATWVTNDSCQPPAIDEGGLALTRP